MEYNLNQNITIKPTEKGIELMVKKYSAEGIPIAWRTNYENEKGRLNDKGELTIKMHQFLDVFGGLSLALPDYVNMNVELSES